MHCVTPMFRLFDSKNPKYGKVISRKDSMGFFEDNPNAWTLKLPKLWADNKRLDSIQKIPCRKCWACQLNYSAEWATRIMLEAKKTPGQNFFVTLTYDDDHLPIAEQIVTREGIYENDGSWGGTLDEKDMIRFINSLRKKYERKGYNEIKYFYCGEYGETTGRPHYHIILLHCPLKIEEFYDCHVDKNFKAHWKSKQLETVWDKGIIDIAELEWSCAAYVARYCAKKISFDKNKAVYYEQGKLPEFIRMSKGIGFDWYMEHKDDIYKTDEIIMRTIRGNIGSAKPPKAFDRKFEEYDPEGFELIKKSRETAAIRAEQMLKQVTDRTDYDNLILDAKKVEQKMKLLPRVGEW